jgi:mycofactocin precursor
MKIPLIAWRGSQERGPTGGDEMQERDQTAQAATDEVAVPDAPALPLELPEDDAELEEMLIREITIDGMCGVY